MESPGAEELLKKILELQQSQDQLNQEMLRLKVSSELRKRRNTSDGESPPPRTAESTRRVHGSTKSTKKLTNKQYLNLLQSISQSVHVLDLNTRIIFWNAMSEKLYGYSAEEVVGKSPLDAIVDDKDVPFAMNVAQRCANGEHWTGEFPVKTKSGRMFLAVTTCSPFYDDAGSLIGIISITSNIEPYRNPGISSFASRFGLESEQSIQVAITSKISDFATKVSNKVRSRMRASVDTATLSEGSCGDSYHSSVASTPRGDFIHSPFGVFTHEDEKFTSRLIRDLNGESDGKSAIRKVLTERLEVKEGLLQSWKVAEQDGSKGRPNHSDVRFERRSYESNKPINTEAFSLWSSSTDTNSTSNASNCASSSSSVDVCSEPGYEILWEDLTIGEQIGQGSCGTVYRGLWFGCDVALKVFSKQEYSEEVIQSFRQEVSLMKRFRHPNVLLFMGAVTTPQRLCIVSEFVPRGSLFRLLQRTTTKLDWRRRIQMALDIARGMNYLHCCNPPIIHRDLKSSNLLVDRNCSVKVADFGLSRIKHATYLSSKSGKGTPQWMAPEVLRNESADEKSDIYSFGVVLWELATHKIPWETLNPMQVIGTVAFMDQRLEIPKDIDPLWISLIESCWHSDTKLRPTFRELIEKLRDMQRKYTLQSQATRAA